MIQRADDIYTPPKDRDRLVYEHYENVLEDHVAELVHRNVMGLKWYYGNMSNRNEANKHWNVSCGHDRQEVIDNGFDWILPIFDACAKKFNFEQKYELTGFSRAYMNAHTHGVEPHWHRDDGDFTILYYPRTDWQVEWGGGTVIYGEEEDAERPYDPKHGLFPTTIAHTSQYIGNSLIIFDAWRWHNAQAVRRECYELRPIIVFKSEISGHNADRLEFYKIDESQTEEQTKVRDYLTNKGNFDDLIKPKDKYQTDSIHPYDWKKLEWDG